MSELASDIIYTFQTPGPPDGCFAETVTGIEHYSDRLFRFRMTWPASLRFRSGEFVMIGLPGDRPEFRPIRSPRLAGTTGWNSI